MNGNQSLFQIYLYNKYLYVPQFYWEQNEIFREFHECTQIRRRISTYRGVIKAFRASVALKTEFCLKWILCNFYRAIHKFLCILWAVKKKKTVCITFCHCMSIDDRHLWDTCVYVSKAWDPVWFIHRNTSDLHTYQFHFKQSLGQKWIFRHELT